jgi:hypothetical protein
MAFLILVALSLLAAVPGGRIRNRPTAALVGSLVAFSIFAAPYLAWGIGLGGGGHMDDQEDLPNSIILAAVVGLPVALLGAFVALIANTVWHPPERKRTHN